MSGRPDAFMATGVAVGGRAVLIAGPPGSGKSTLALALIDRGAALIGDDAVRLERCGAALVAHPPPRIAGLLELRNLGLATVPTASAPVALMLRLARDAPRFVERAASETIAGVPVPALAFDPFGPAAVRAEWALRLHGAAIAEPVR